MSEEEDERENKKEIDNFSRVMLMWITVSHVKKTLMSLAIEN